MDSRLWEIAEAICRARLKEAWGSTHGTFKFDQLRWPSDARARRAYQHNPVAEIDLALASAKAVLPFIGRPS